MARMRCCLLVISEEHIISVAKKAALLIHIFFENVSKINEDQGFMTVIYGSAIAL